jgi:2-oxoglutarate ferredoxin oxidoreductase subunit gamma
MAKSEIRIAGLGGQGVILSGLVLGKAASVYNGLHATLIQSFGPEARGSSCSAQVIISDQPIAYPYVKQADILVLLSAEAAKKFLSELKPQGLVVYENELINDLGILAAGTRVRGIPATRIAEGLGRRLVLNMVMVGFIVGTSNVVSYAAAEQALRATVPPASLDLNLKALESGYSYTGQGDFISV